jgi:hypothetical protein
MSSKPNVTMNRLQQYLLFGCTAIFCNPVLLLHAINATVDSVAAKKSPHLADESSFNPYLDVHASEKLGWIFTLVMVAVQ